MVVAVAMVVVVVMTVVVLKVVVIEAVGLVKRAGMKIAVMTCMVTAKLEAMRLLAAAEDRRVGAASNV